jgi:hypothetical protein
MNYQEKCKWLADFYREAAETDREMQVYNEGPRAWETADCGPNCWSTPSGWRLKPEPPKAWVVWFDGLPPHLSESLNSAQTWNKFECDNNGTIQEITRPD